MCTTCTNIHYCNAWPQQTSNRRGQRTQLTFQPHSCTHYTCIWSINAWYPMRVWPQKLSGSSMCASYWEMQRPTEDFLSECSHFPHFILLPSINAHSLPLTGQVDLPFWAAVYSHISLSKDEAFVVTLYVESLVVLSNSIVWLSGPCRLGAYEQRMVPNYYIHV